MSYVSRQDINAGPVPYAYIVQALDDDGDGREDDGLFDALAANIGTQIDAMLAPRYEVPFDEPPDLVRAAAFNWANYELYRRRGVPDAQNPCAPAHQETLEALRAVARGAASLPGATARHSAAAGSQKRAPGRMDSAETLDDWSDS